MNTLKSPYPWFGGKSSIASMIWDRFGKVRNYVEPFMGSAAMLLCRPRPFEGTETVNDADCMVSNFWRALQADPEAVASFADWPVNEADLHARHLWLVTLKMTSDFRERMKTEHDFYDTKVAGWWVWGCCQWIGAGWCEHPEWEQLPHLGDAGRGIHRPSQKRPNLQVGAGGKGVFRIANGNLYEYFNDLATRLRNVRVCCGDWSRVMGPTPTVKQGLTAVFLDPPYSGESGRDGQLYASECLKVAHDVRDWCLEYGNDKQLRIALCGYEGEHEALEDHGWTVEHWKARGGYSSQAKISNGNSARERIWFSPHCIDSRLPLFNH